MRALCRDVLVQRDVRTPRNFSEVLRSPLNVDDGRHKLDVVVRRFFGKATQAHHAIIVCALGGNDRNNLRCRIRAEAVDEGHGLSEREHGIERRPIEKGTTVSDASLEGSINLHDNLKRRILNIAHLLGEGWSKRTRRTLTIFRSLFHGYLRYIDRFPSCIPGCEGGSCGRHPTKPSGEIPDRHAPETGIATHA